MVGYDYWFFKKQKDQHCKKQPGHDECSDKQQPRHKKRWQRSILLQTFTVAPEPQWTTALTIVNTPTEFYIPTVGSTEIARAIAERDFVLKVATVPLIQLTRFDIQDRIVVPCRPHMTQALQFINELYLRDDKQLQNLLIEQVKTLVVNITTEHPGDTTAPERFKTLILEQAPNVAEAIRWE